MKILKIYRCFLVVCIMTFADNIDANAQSASKFGGIVKGLVKKASKPKSKVKPNLYKNKSTKEKPNPITIIDCGNCRGRGKVNVWNQYYGWQTQKCKRCNGTGKVIY